VGGGHVKIREFGRAVHHSRWFFFQSDANETESTLIRLMRTATNARRTPNEKNILTSEVTAAANKWKRSTKETP